MTARPCRCQTNGDCYLCAIWASAQGLPVKMPKPLPKPEPVKTEPAKPVSARRPALFDEIEATIQ